jgi:hypothetical protein
MKHEFVRDIFQTLLKYETSQKSVQWKPICSGWMDGHTEAESFFATLRTRLKSQAISLKIVKNYVYNEVPVTCKGITQG